MRFIVSRQNLMPETADKIVWLSPDNWDDYTFRTTFNLQICIKNKWRSLGYTRIIKTGQESNIHTLNKLAEDGLMQFERLPSNYCSLSTSPEFYKNIRDLDPTGEIYNEILDSLNDVTFNPEKASLFKNRAKNIGFYKSLLRDSEAAYLFNQAQREPLYKNFKARIQLSGAISPHEIEVDFERYGDLPNRVFVIVGENGVGKTQLLSRLAISISGYEKHTDHTKTDYVEPRGIFSNVLTLSFSAYDDFEIPNIHEFDKSSYRYCGLRKPNGSISNTETLLQEAVNMIVGLDTDRTNIFIDTTDRIFPDLDLSHLLPHNMPKTRHIDIAKHNLARKTSAGQRIALITLLNLLTYLKDNTLVIFDEPETHLHPTLLTTLLDIMSELLDRYNSYSIISTHSPLVLQQIPRRYVKIIKRTGNIPIITSVSEETFGENLTEITHHVFDVHEDHRDYKDVFKKLLELHNNSPEAVAKMFDGKLGLSARSLLYSLAKIVE